MKPVLKLLLSLFALGGTAAITAADSSQADADYAAFSEIAAEPGKLKPEQLTPEFYENHSRRAGDAALRFYEMHPQDSRSLRALYFYAGYMKDFRHMAELRQNNANALVEAALAAPDISQKDWEMLKGRQIRGLVSNTFEAPKEWRAPGMARLRAAIDELARRIPDAGSLVSREMAYNHLLQEVDPAAARKHMEALAQSPNTLLRSTAEGRLRTQRLRDTPLEMKFTAVDGREVDVNSLRGKVVLLDFWATWCGPCIAELPNIKSVYERYHDKGFEVIGISLDTPEDTEKLRAFIRDRGVPWPQHHDTERKNRFAAQFGVTAIPVQLLLDQQGKLVHDTARGEVLEQEVKRLLKL